MIVCLEGASAVGKTTTCRALHEQFGAAVIPEVNALFERPPSASADWYLERQVERWAFACQSQMTYPLTVLDGDPFQPFWYNWSFGFQEWQNLNHLCGFFRPLVASGVVGFPNRYFLLVAPDEKLRQRRNGDLSRSRRNFERHLRFIEPQRRYFSTMAFLAPSLVEVIEADSIPGNIACIQNMAVEPMRGTIEVLELFDALVEWLRDNEL